MAAYIFRRLLLIIPTVFGIMLLNFLVIQAAPGGPIEQILAQIEGGAVGATERFTGGGSDVMAAKGGEESLYRGGQGLAPEYVEQLKVQFGFDKPLWERFVRMMGQYIQFDFGDSFFHDKSVVDLVLERLPVSISLGLWSTLIIYCISIPLGIAKAVRDGSRFDIYTSGAIIVGYAIPAFLFAVLLIIFFAGGRYFDWFPLRGLVSDDWETLSWYQQILDYAWHMALPVLALTIGGFAGLTMLTKNAFLDEINKHYVMTARAKGLTEHQVLYGHVFRNAMLIVIAGFPATLIGLLFTGSLLIEVMFNLDGLGLLGFNAILTRDYPVIFGSLFFSTLLGLVVSLVSDLMYVVVDPRIDFDSREV